MGSVPLRNTAGKVHDLSRGMKGGECDKVGEDI
jgi:hypothetical protein